MFPFYPLPFYYRSWEWHNSIDMNPFIHELNQINDLCEYSQLMSSFVWHKVSSFYHLRVALDERGLNQELIFSLLFYDRYINSQNRRRNSIQRIRAFVSRAENEKQNGNDISIFIGNGINYTKCVVQCKLLYQNGKYQAIKTLYDPKEQPPQWEKLIKYAESESLNGAKGSLPLYLFYNGFIFNNNSNSPFNLFPEHYDSCNQNFTTHKENLCGISIVSAYHLKEIRKHNDSVSLSPTQMVGKMKQFHELFCCFDENFERSQYRSFNTENISQYLRENYFFRIGYLRNNDNDDFREIPYLNNEIDTDLDNTFALVIN